MAECEECGEPLDGDRDDADPPGYWLCAVCAGKGDGVISTRVKREFSIEVNLEYVNPAIWWLLGIVRFELLHDATWDGERIA